MNFKPRPHGENLSWPTPHPELQDLMDLCLNNLDGYSAVLFVANKMGGPLGLAALQSLSKNIDPSVKISPGKGLLGWVYKNAKAVNVDEVSFETERLLFYTCDENIKSFMAVPLPAISGVLAVDSKQQYIFTDKSAKLLFQFGQSIERVWQRLNPSTSKNQTSSRPNNGSSSFSDDLCSLWLNLETSLARPDHEGGGLSSALELIKEYAGLSWAFMTAMLPSDSKHYHIIAKSDNAPDTLPSKHPLSSGLAGWVHTKHKPLILDKLKGDGRRSFLFQKDEPLKGIRSFYGWPLTYHDQPRGGIFLAGQEGELLTSAQCLTLECVAARLAAQLQQDRLLVKVLNLCRLDSQTGLPHRAYFIERLGHMLEITDLNRTGLELFVLATAGLGAFACDNGGAAAGELLEAMAKDLRDLAQPHWELGHVSYGVFTLAVPTGDLNRAKDVILRFKNKLQNWPLVERSGRISLMLFPAMASYPKDAVGAEELLELALTALVGTDNDEAYDDTNSDEAK
ncbi:MAG: GAF domain-containing protein [Candidatus Adiutrix sp.]